MKYFYIKFLVFVSSLYSLTAFWETTNKRILDNMAPEWNSILKVEVAKNWNEWINVLDSLLNIIKDLIFWLLPVIATFVFLLIWTKLFLARWNPDEFKKAMMWFVYAAVWIAIVPLAWWIIYLITTLTI